jgi:UDP-N-acetylmuramoyl-tripeptide--D-alanyl-D-alanine ligase
VRDLPPVEHRLQKIENGDVTVLDDAYNSNVQGARIALEVLHAFDGTRIVITPGLVELGEEEEAANFALGESVFAAADYAYFVGGRAETLKAGALHAGMAADNVFVCATLDEAVKQSGAIAGKKTILFENDLPDNL